MPASCLVAMNIKSSLLPSEEHYAHSSWTFSVCKFLKDSTGTCCTRVYIFSSESSSSLRFRDIRTRTRFGTFLTPLLHRNLFNLVSIRTSVVCIDFSTNLRISRTQRGARFLKEMPCIFL